MDFTQSFFEWEAGESFVYIFRSLLDTYSASHTSRKVNGDEYTDKHRDASIAKIKDILGKPEVPDQEVQVDVTNEFIMVMHRQKSSK